jgi:hypothetical protein
MSHTKYTSLLSQHLSLFSLLGVQFMTNVHSGRGTSKIIALTRRHKTKLLVIIKSSSDFAVSHLSTVSICSVRVSVLRFPVQAMLPLVAAVQVGHSGVHTGHLAVAILLRLEQHCSQTDVA